MSVTPRRVFMVGATGTIGRATLRTLLDDGHDVTCFVRARGSRDGHARADATADVGDHPSASLRGTATVRHGDVTSAQSIRDHGFCGETFDVVVSCMASRTGAPRDAWDIDHQAHALLLAESRAAGVTQWVQLSAICVQKPRLAFQHAKLAFERELMASDLAWSIVRATAYFKSLVGQVARVQQGKPFLVFGDGTLTACKPISDRDLARYLADCVHDVTRHRRVLPIGGPGEPITPRAQGEHLFALLGKPPRFSQVPPGLLRGIAGVLGAFGRVVPPLAAKAELARIGHYYATESMLVWDAAAGRYDAAATPEAGEDTLFAYVEALVAGREVAERGEHAVL
jgi:divinyl chlorophyllide a 8-vinyl-reductase